MLIAELMVLHLAMIHYQWLLPYVLWYQFISRMEVGGYHGGQSNPVAIATDGGTNNFTSQEITANISATINLMKGLDLRGQYGLVKYNSKRNRLLKTINYYSPDDDKLIYQSNFPNSIRMDHYSQTYQTFVGTATYRTTILDKHNITGLLGYSLEETVGADFWASRQNLPVQDLESLAVGTEKSINTIVQVHRMH
jgi:hypothetical protein